MGLLKTIGISFAKFITLKEYHRIVNENSRARSYNALMRLMETVAKQRRVTCKPEELSRSCPMSFVIDQYFQRGRNSDGTAALRIFTIIGSDGQIMNIQGLDLSQTINMTVRHTNGKIDFEQIDPSEAIIRMGREAGYSQ
jgi:hypothetical protein